MQKNRPSCTECIASKPSQPSQRHIFFDAYWYRISHFMTQSSAENPYRQAVHAVRGLIFTCCYNVLADPLAHREPEGGLNFSGSEEGAHSFFNEPSDLWTKKMMILVFFVSSALSQCFGRACGENSLSQAGGKVSTVPQDSWLFRKARCRLKRSPSNGMTFLWELKQSFMLE